jgi:hypothetical protein
LHLFRQSWVKTVLYIVLIHFLSEIYAMANTLTNLIPDAYAALDIVSRELVGMIPAVTVDATASRAALNQAVRVPIAPANGAGFDVTPAMSIPAAADQTIGNTNITITKSRGYPFSWNGEEQGGLNNGGPGYFPIRANQLLQCMRALVNEVEADLCGLQNTFSRAHGSTTVPFGTAGDFTDASNVLRILKDNGAPISDNQLILGTAAGANFIGKQSNSSVDYDNGLMSQGILRTISGMDMRESGQVVQFTAGSFSSGTLTSAVRAAGSTVLVATADYTAGLGQGDVITLAHESNVHKYVIQAVAAGSITIQAPGLRTATAATGTVAITKIASTTRNMAFNRSAIVLAVRQPARPVEGDLAIDVTSVTDPRSGLTFEISVYPGNRMVRYEVALAWGVKNIKPEHTAILLG